jgi:hypothetical protein
LENNNNSARNELLYWTNEIDISVDYNGISEPFVLVQAVADVLPSQLL